jgi:hypothetical protein
MNVELGGSVSSTVTMIGADEDSALNYFEAMGKAMLRQVAAMRQRVAARELGLELKFAGCPSKPHHGQQPLVVNVVDHILLGTITCTSVDEQAVLMGGGWVEAYGLPDSDTLRMIALDGAVVWEGPRPKCAQCPNPAASYHENALCESCAKAAQETETCEKCGREFPPGTLTRHGSHDDIIDLCPECSESRALGQEFTDSVIRQYGGR